MKSNVTHTVIKRLIPPLAAWAVARVLETPKMQDALAEADARALVHQRNAARAVRRAGKNVASNPAWFIAGLAAVAVGVGLMVKATRGK